MAVAYKDCREVIRLLRRLLDPPDRPYLEAMRSLWRIPADWQHRPTWRVKVLKRGLAMIAPKRKAG